MVEQAKQPTILVVDDEEGLLLLIGNALRREGLKVTTAASGRAALEWLSGSSADLMLLDLKLSEIEASDLVNRLGAVGRTVPFIIITGQGDERVAVEMMKRGALDYLIKDVQFIELVPTVVRRALDQLAKEKRLTEAEKAWRRSEVLLAQTQEITHVGGYEINLTAPGGDRWSEETFRILGLDPARKELTPDEYISGRVHLDDQARVREAFDKSRHESVRSELEYRIVRPDGSVRHVLSIFAPGPGANNPVVKLVGTLQDITERKELEREILGISEREQSRISQDLHDGLCQHLAGIEFRLLGLKQKLLGKASRQATEATELAKLVRDAIDQTRALARGLSPVMLDPDGLTNALKELALNTEKAFGITCSLNCPMPVLIHDNAVATHLYRIAQEAIHNAIRHSKGKFIVINLLAQNDRMVLGVKDDGVGLPKEPRQHKGMGLRVMQYRAGMVGGSLVVQRDAEGGTSVICSLHRGERTAQPEGRKGN